MATRRTRAETHRDLNEIAAWMRLNPKCTVKDVSDRFQVTSSWVRTNWDKLKVQLAPKFTVDATVRPVVTPGKEPAIGMGVNDRQVALSVVRKVYRTLDI